MHELLLLTFEALERESLAYCVLRDGERMQMYARGGEVDLLVPDAYLKKVESLLHQIGFAHVPAWGHEPHRFYIVYHKQSDCWIKLDIVTSIAYDNPSHALATTLAENCLQNRRHNGLVYMPSPEDEFITLLLHCVLDKGYIAQHRGARLQALSQQIEDDVYLSQLIRQYWNPNSNWSMLSKQVEREAWGTLLAQRDAVVARLTQRAPLAVLGRRVRDRLLRKAQRGIGYFRPRTPSVALLAPDGAGKSTLAHGLGESFYFPVQLLYMGLYQNGGRKRKKKVAGLGLARNLLTQWQRYLVSRHYRAGGRLVVFDRYSYDALLPSPQNAPSKGKLRQLRRWLLAHSCPPPDLILFLDAPGELLYSRKGERNPVALETQRQQYLRLQADLPQMVVVDASRGAESVRQDATDLIWKKYAQQFG